MTRYQIDALLREAGAYFRENKDKQDLIRRFQKYTFLAYTNGEIRMNNSEISDEELRIFLKSYDVRFKKPVKKLLIEYYRLKHNPDLEFSGSLLKKLGFVICSSCLSQKHDDFNSANI